MRTCVDEERFTRQIGCSALGISADSADVIIVVKHGFGVFLAGTRSNKSIRPYIAVFKALVLQLDSWQLNTLQSYMLYMR
jgi:hypothetical protein